MIQTVANDSEHREPGQPAEYEPCRDMIKVPGEVTILLEELRNGRAGAESELLALMYRELKRLARYQLRGERPDHTLATTDLVHEAYLRLTGANLGCRDRAHFLGLAATAMRRILVDYARARRAKKRGDGNRCLTFEDALFEVPVQCDYLLELHEALSRLASLDPRKARIVELRFFGDLSVEESAEVLHCSGRTIKREWRFAQAWLRRELSASGTLCKQRGCKP